ncbi:HAD domain-containing protein [Fluoribacter gormanii]|uniref:HAD domain-containing protein n=1 Tax=Fluoribacter gormanii TaxID=464 RepID=UPI0022433E38|nr:HAD domain-containing protein [Fluoribacter gormanii]MCW8471346.1 HAD domain-containing protein [Fluoribacter gormanii]
MKIIFLDIDDVLYLKVYRELSATELQDIRLKLKEKYSLEAVDSLKERFLIAALNFTPLAIDYLKILCQEEDVKIVISSTWRLSNSLEQLQALFSMYELGDKIIGHTPDIYYYNRGQEIESWLIEHLDKIDAFLILDDDNWNISGRFLPRFVHCTQGFHFEQYFLEAQRILKTPLRGDESNVGRYFKAVEQSIASNRPILIRSFDIAEYRLINQCNQREFMDYLGKLIPQGPEDACSFIFESLGSSAILEILSFLDEHKININTLHFLNCYSDLGLVLKSWFQQVSDPLNLKITYRKPQFSNTLLEAIEGNNNLLVEFHYGESVFYELDFGLIFELERKKRINWYYYEGGSEKSQSSKFTYAQDGVQFFKRLPSRNPDDLLISNQPTNSLG